MLGVYTAPDGNNKYQVKYMHKKATAWEASLIVGFIQKKKAWKAINPTIPQKIKYPLASMTLNDKECKHIMKPIINLDPLRLA